MLTSTLFLFLPALTAFSAVTLLVGWQEGHSASSSDVSKTRGVLLMQNQSCKHGVLFHLTTTSTHVLTSTETWLVQTEHATFAHMLLLFFLTPGLNSQGIKKNYAMQYRKVQKSSWNEPYCSSSFTKQSCSMMALISVTVNI